MPDKIVASLLLPIAMVYLPILVWFSTNAINRTKSSTHTNPNGYFVSPIVILKISLNQLPSEPLVGHEIPKLLEHIDPSPLVIIHVQSVAKNGGRLIMDTNVPFKVPINTPNNTDTIIPAHVGHPQWTTR